MMSMMTANERRRRAVPTPTTDDLLTLDDAGRPRATANAAPAATGCACEADDEPTTNERQTRPLTIPQLLDVPDLTARKR